MVLGSKVYKLKDTLRGGLPGFAKDILGDDIYNKLNQGGESSLPKSANVDQFKILLVEVKKKKKKAAKKKTAKK